MCISCVRYDAFMGRLQLFFVQDRHAFCALLACFVIFPSQGCHCAEMQFGTMVPLIALYWFIFQALSDASEVPVAGLCHDEVAEGFQLGGVLHLVRIAEIGIEGWDVGRKRQLNEAWIAPHNIIGKAGNADS